MKDDVVELRFSGRSDFREWLSKNAETSGGVWLVFGKTKDVVTLTANDALEEALCFGWIDGQMKSIDASRYLKYFARRREKSVWSEKNKKIAEALAAKGMMTDLGKKAVEAAKKNGAWDAAKREPVTGEQVEKFTQKLAGFSLALENFRAMSPSVRRSYTGGYFSIKSEEARNRNLLRIVDRLNKNLKPM